MDHREYAKSHEIKLKEGDIPLFIQTSIAEGIARERRALLEKIESKKCSPGDIVTGWVINMNDIRDILSQDKSNGG